MQLVAVYSRTINGDTLVLGASGWTYNRTFVLRDCQTASMWHHLEGTVHRTAIVGPYADSTLAELPSVLTRWNSWKDSHPDSRFLKEPTQP